MLNNMRRSLNVFPVQLIEADCSCKMFKWRVRNFVKIYGVLIRKTNMICVVCIVIAQVGFFYTLPNEEK